MSFPVYDPNTGAVISYGEQPQVVEAPGVSDSGYSYGNDIFKLLSQGLGAYADKERYEFDQGRRYEMGRNGSLSGYGIPMSPFAGAGGGINAMGLVFAVVLIGGVLWFALRK